MAGSGKGQQEAAVVTRDVILAGRVGGILSKVESKVEEAAGDIEFSLDPALVVERGIVCSVLYEALAGARNGGCQRVGGSEVVSKAGWLVGWQRLE